MRIYLAGFNGGKGWSAIKKPLRRAFASHFYSEPPLFVKAKSLGVNIVLDSGAHTYLDNASVSAFGMNSGRKKELPHPTKFFDDYMDWLKNGGADSIDYFVELDILKVVGKKQVYQWRKRILDLGLGHKCIIGYHPREEPFDDFMRWAKRFPSRYVGLEPMLIGNDYSHIIKVFWDEAIRPHCFASIAHRHITKIPFFSVDSASWITPLTLGTIPYFNGTRIISVDPNKKPKCVKTLAFYHKMKRVRAEDKASGALSGCEQQALASIDAYEQYEDWLTRYWKSRGIDWDAHMRGLLP